MYSTSSIPPAATGVVIATPAASAAWNLPIWITLIATFLAIFALIGAVLAAKRALPVTSVERKWRARRTEKKLMNRRR